MTPDTFTPEQIREDGQSRITKTAAQAGGLAAPTMLIVIEALHGLHWLHGDLRVDLVLAYQAVLTTVFATLMNLRRLRGKA